MSLPGARLVVVSALLAGTLPLACTREPRTPDPVALHARLVTDLETWGPYSASLESELHTGPIIARHLPDGGVSDLEPMRIALELDVQPPENMRMRARSQEGGRSFAFDGVWTHTDAVSITVQTISDGRSFESIARVDSVKARVPGSPFDIGFNPRGFGVMEGEDLHGTVATLLRAWRFHELSPTTFAGRPVLALRGTVDVDVAIDEALGPGGVLVAAALAAPATEGADADAAAMHARLVDNLATMMGDALRAMTRAELFVTPQGELVGWTLSGPAGLLQKVTLKRLDKRVTHAPDRFTLAAEKTAAAHDVTPDVLASRSAAPPDAAALARFRAAVRAGATAP